MRRWILFVALCALSIGIFYYLVVLPGMKTHQSACNLAIISMALQNYLDVHGQFPPPHIAGTDGKPMHSWRVLILPFLSEDELYRQYDFNEPWNGPHNRRLADKMPAIFRGTTDVSSDSNTSYFAVVSPQTMWSTDRVIKKNDFPNGMSRIAVVEVNNRGITWSEPRDLSLTEAISAIKCGDDNEHPCPHSEGTLAISANASTVWLKKEATEAELRARFIINNVER